MAFSSAFGAGCDGMSGTERFDEDTRGREAQAGNPSQEAWVLIRSISLLVSFRLFHALRGVAALLAAEVVMADDWGMGRGGVPFGRGLTPFWDLEESARPRE